MVGIVCYVNYLINKPLKVLKNYTIPTEFIYNNTKIALAWTDDNTGETLIIQSDKKEYNGFSSVDVYLSITNISRKDQDMDVVFWVGDEKVKVEGIERLESDENSHPVARKPLGGYSLNGYLRKDIKGFTAGHVANDTIKSGQTNYYKATIKYPPMSKGEFFIEAFGKSAPRALASALGADLPFAYGHLDPWYASNWNYKREITINASQIATTTSAFPVLATTTLADLKTTTNGGKVGNDNGYDIVFVDSNDSTLLNFEREKYASTTGEIAYWIKTDISSTTDKTIYMYYGNSGASDLATTTGVWDDNYVGVWHMNEASGSLIDSTKNSLNLTSVGGTPQYSQSSQIGDGILFDAGSSEYFEVSTAAVTDAPLTICGWYNTDSLTAFQIIGGVFDSGSYNNQIRLALAGDEAGDYVQAIIWDGFYSHADTTIAYSTGIWQYACGVYVSTSERHVYLNANNKGTNTDSRTPSSIDTTSIGRSGDSTPDAYMSGIIDEVRISNVARTAGWIATEYNNQSDVGSFMTIGEEQTNNWYDNDWKYRKRIDINSSQIATTTSNFPILATTTLAVLKTTTHDGKVESDSGHDIIFVDALGNTLLNFEREYYASTTGEIAYWIKTDISSTTDKTIYMYYGNAGQSTDLATTTGVWDDNYKMVQHLQEDPSGGATPDGSDEIFDSTKYDNDGNTGGTMLTEDQVAGQIDGSLDFDGGDDYVDCDDIDAVEGISALSVSAWVKVDDLTTDGTIIIKGIFVDNGFPFLLWRDESGANSGRADTFSFRVDGTGTEAQLEGATNASSDNDWHHIVGTYVGGSATGLRLYIDGVEDANSPFDASAVNPLLANTHPVTIGKPTTTANKEFTGIIDEVRISNTARDAQWIETEYNNQVSVGSFMTFGAEESFDYKLVITSSAQVLITGTESSAFTAQIQNTAGEAEILGSALTVNLSSDSSGTNYFAATASGAAVTSVTIPQGSNSVNFYYTDHKAGAPTITVAATNFTSGTQQQTVQSVWYNTGYQCRRQITLDADQIATTTSSFPILATTTLADLKTTTFGGCVANDNGHDIIFVDDDNSTLLNFEREKYASTTGEIAYWIKTDISSTTDKTIYMYYGNSGASDLATTTGVWDDDYVMVQHLHHDWDATAVDSAKYDNDGTNTNFYSATSSVTAQIDGGIDFDGADDYVDILNGVAGGHSFTGLSDAITIMAWIKPDAIIDTDSRWRPAYTVIELRNQGTTGVHVPFSFGVDDSKILIGCTDDYTDGEERYHGDTTISVDTWYHIAVTFSGDNWELFLDGQSDGSGSWVAAAGDRSVGANTAHMQIGCRTRDGGQKDSSLFNGLIDEVRVSDVARSAQWIETEYNNQVAMTDFMTFGAEEGVPAAVEFVSVIKQSGGEYSSLFDWEAAIDCDLTVSATKVYSIIATSSMIADGAAVTAGASTATLLHQASSSQILLINISGLFNSGDYVTDASNNSVILSDNGNSAIAVAKIDGAWSSADTTAVTITDWTTSANNYIKIYTTTAARHDGTAGTGYVLEPSSASHGIQILENYTRIEGLEITNWTTNSGGSYDGINIAADHCLIDSVIVHDDGHGTESNSDAGGIQTDTDNITVTIRNCIVYDLARWGISTHNTDGTTFDIENCTVYKCTVADDSPTGYGCVGHDGHTSIINAKNVIAMDVQNGGADFKGTNWGTSSHNISSDATAPGSNSLTSKSAANQFVSITSGSENLHLKSGADALDVGINLYSTAGFQDDIDGTSRDASWDIGADEWEMKIITQINTPLTNKWTDGLVGYWSFNGEDMDWASSTAEALDRSGQGNHGDVIGATAVIGKVGQGLEFNGSDNYVDCGNSNSLEMGTSDWSISIWSKMVINSEIKRLIYKGAGSTTGEGYYFWYYPTNGDLRFYISDGVSRLLADSNDNLGLADGEWHHILVSADRSGNAYFYVDGSSVGSESISSFDGTDITNTGIDLHIGRKGDGYFNGSIDEVRVYNRALSADEIAEQYRVGARKFQVNTPITNKLTSGLVGHWTFNGEDMDWASSTAEALDRSGQGNHGDIIGATAVIGKVGQGLEFDGSDDCVELTDLDVASSMTVSAWVNLNSTASEQIIIRKTQVSDGSLTNYWLSLYDGGSGSRFHFGFAAQNPTGWKMKDSSVLGTPSTGVWYYVTGVFDDANNIIELYVDGTSQGTTEVTGTPGQNNDNTIIGSNQGGSSNFLNGTIDEVRIYNRALSASEVGELYRAGARRVRF